MSKYFVCKIWIFDMEEYQTAESIRQQVEREMDLICEDREGLVWEEVEVKEVELGEYEKEMQNEEI